MNQMRLDSSGVPSASNLIMEMLKVRCPIVNFHLLIGSFIKCDSGWYTQKFLGHLNSFKKKPWTQPKVRDLRLPGSLMPIKLILPQRNKAANGVRLVLKASVVSTWSLHFSKAFLVACGFATTGLSLGEQLHAELCHCPKFFFDILGRSRSFFFGVSKLI